MALEPGDENLKRLFKFRDDSERTLELLRTREAFFPFPSQINDPFDCKFPVSFDCTEYQIFSWIAKLPIADPQKQVMFDSYKKGQLDNEAILDWYRKDQSRISTIYCLSEVNDNQLMWSHYSNGHKGICVGFETHVFAKSLCLRFDDPLLRRMGDLYLDGYIPTFKVTYLSNRPAPYNVFTGNYEDIKPHITSKSDIWCYEKERRIAASYLQLQTQKLRFDRSSIKDVYFGASSSERFISDVLNILKKEYWTKGHDVRVYRMKCSDREYKLEVVDLNL